MGDRTAQICTHVFVVASLFTTGDDKVRYTMPCDAMFVGPVSASLGTLGTTSGSTIVNVENISNSENITRNITFATTDSDLTAEGVLVATAVAITAGDGDVIGVNVDSCTTAATEKDLTVTIHYVGR